MDKAVVIGGAGFVGSHVADELSRRGYRVTIFDREASPWITESQEMCVGDMRDQAALMKAISNFFLSSPPSEPIKSLSPAVATGNKSTPVVFES